MQIIKKLYFEFNRSTSILFTGSFLNTASPHSRDNPRDVDVIFVCFPVSSGTLISSEDKVLRAWTRMHFERIQRFEWCFKSVRNCMSCILVNATWKTHKNSKCRKSLCHFLVTFSIKSVTNACLFILYARCSKNSERLYEKAIM